MFGLPFVTSLFVFGGFLVPLFLAIWFGLRFRSDGQEWRTIDDLFSRKQGGRTTPGRTGERDRSATLEGVERS